MAIINDFYFNYSRKLICHATLSINYNGQTTNFTVGQLIQNAASSPTKTAVIAYDTDAGATGTLDVVYVVGSWANTDPIYVGSTQYASVTGTPTAKTTIYTTNQLYSLTTTLFDDAIQMDDVQPMSAQTPTAFTLINGWFIDPLSTQYLKSGSLQTIGWTHPTYGDGVRVITFVSNYAGAVLTDIGKPVVYTGGSPNHSGRLLHYDNTLQKWWVRCDNAASTFSNTATAIVITGGTGSGIIAGGTNVTGENVWTNIYTLGTLGANTQIYIYQNNARPTPWWTTGHIDILISVKEAGALIGSGNVTIFARHYTTLYDHYAASLSSGNQTPIPLATFTDANNATGYRTFTGSSGSGTFQVGEILSYGTTAYGIVTAVAGTTVAPVLTYYLYRAPFTDFANGNTPVSGASSLASCTAGTPANSGPATLDGSVTITFAGISRDLNNGNGARNYDVEIDCVSNALADVYQYLKWVTRHGSTSYLHSVAAECYQYADAAYDPVKQSPFGTFAGGKFFGARGVWLKNIPAADANNYQLVDSAGVTQIPPQSITLTVNGVLSGDQVAVFKSTGSGSSTVDKSQFAIQQTLTSPVAYIRVTASIPNDTPASGYIRVVRRDAAADILGEERYAYTSWNNADQPTYSSFVLTGTTSQNYGTTDTAYVGYLDDAASGASLSVSLLSVTTRYITVRVRRLGIIPFLINSSFNNSSVAITATRTTDGNYAADYAVGFTLNYTRKTITHSSGTTVYTTKQLYNYCIQQLTAVLQMDDAVPMSAQTPTAFSLTNSWFIDPTTIQFLKSGSLQSTDWTHPTSTDGIRVLSFGTYGGPPDATDIGKAVVGGTTGHGGRLLAYNNTLKKWSVRANTAADTFNTAENITITGGTSGTRTTTGASTSGENIWTNIYTLGTLAANTQIYLYQNAARIIPWWATGHIDVLVLVKETGSLIDSGNVTIFARQYSKLYDHYTAALSSGNQTPIPLATFPDTNNLTGYRQFTGSSGSGTFVVGDLIQKSGDATIQGVITAVNGPTLTPTITYFLFAYPFTDFTNGTAVVQVPSGPTCTAGTPSDAGPALLGLSVTFGTISRDLNNGNGAHNYDVEINCASNALADVYQYVKYLTRYGAAGTLNSANSESYQYANGTYDPVKQSPFGTFAGGTFFGARGVWLKNIPLADANNYQLVDASGTTQIPPTTITLTVTGLQPGDRVTVFRTTGDNEVIDRTLYTSHASNNTAGANTFDIQTAIEADTPSSGVIRVIDDSLNKETRYTFTSWSGSRFSGISPVLVTTYDNTDTAYVPFIDEQATGTSITKATTYSTNRYVLTVVRIHGVVPFKVKGQVTNSNFAVTAIRTADSVYQ